MPLLVTTGVWVAPAGALKPAGSWKAMVLASKSRSRTSSLNTSLPRTTGIGRPISFSIADRSISTTVRFFSSRSPILMVTLSASWASCVPPVPTAMTAPLGLMPWAAAQVLSRTVASAPLSNMTWVVSPLTLAGM